MSDSSNTSLSDTPRVDAHCKEIGGDDGLCYAAFARQLERELAEARKLIDILCPGKMLKTSEEIGAYLQSIPSAIAHTDHPLRHWDRTCPACLALADEENRLGTAVSLLMRLLDSCAEPWEEASFMDVRAEAADFIATVHPMECGPFAKTDIASSGVAGIDVESILLRIIETPNESTLIAEDALRLLKNRTTQVVEHAEVGRDNLGSTGGKPAESATSEDFGFLFLAKHGLVKPESSDDKSRYSAIPLEEVECTMKDAERYRWLRDPNNDEAASGIFNTASGSRIDAAIDAAMNARTPQNLTKEK